MDPILEQLATEVERFRGGIRELPVVPAADAGEIREHLARYDFAAPVPLGEVVDDVAAMMRQWTLHATHPRYFGLFNPGPPLSSVVADALAALYNPQVGGWSHSPAANEIERHVLRFLLGALGFDVERSAAHFTSGGSEANHTAVIAALVHVFPPYAECGVRALSAQPVMYVSGESHHSFTKIARYCGIGAAAVRVVPTDARFRLDVGTLREWITTDRASGHAPFMIVATAGTTTGGAIDPLDAVADMARDEGLWCHVDAAWGGAAVLVPRLRPLLAGIGRADSVTWDAHKWLSVSMGAGMFFCRHPAVLDRAFGVHAPYVPRPAPGTTDQYMASMQWSRRFIGLKLFLELAELGVGGLAAQLEHQTRMGERLREALVDGGWVVVNDTELPLVCFTHPRIRSGETSAGTVVRRLLAGRRAWVSEAVLRGEHVLRACITHADVHEHDLEVLLAELEAALGEAHGGAHRASERQLLGRD